jgi:hypothetical protein
VRGAITGDGRISLGAVNLLSQKGARMKKQTRLGLLAVALTALLAMLALPGLAGADVKITVLAAEYSDNLFVAAVLASATAGEDPSRWNVALSVNGIPFEIQTGEIKEDLIFKGARVWKIVREEDVIKQLGDKLTADVAGFSDSAICGAGVRRLHITAICK